MSNDPTSIELLAYQRLAETGLSAAELLSMGMDEYARATGRATMGQVAAQALDSDKVPGTPRTQQTPASVHEPAPAQNAPQPPAPQGVDIASMDWQQYAQFRQEAGIGQGQREGRGIFDLVGSRSQAYTDATRAQSGRTAMSNANVQEPPRLEGRYARQDDQRDTRSVAQRFGTPGNSWRP